MEERVQKIERKVDEIHQALIGNDEFKQEGLVDQVHKNTKFRRRSGWFAGLFTTLGAALSKLFGG